MWQAFSLLILTILTYTYRQNMFAQNTSALAPVWFIGERLPRLGK